MRLKKQVNIKQRKCEIKITIAFFVLSIQFDLLAGNHKELMSLETRAYLPDLRGLLIPAKDDMSYLFR